MLKATALKALALTCILLLYLFPGVFFDRQRFHIGCPVKPKLTFFTMIWQVISFHFYSHRNFQL